MGRTLPIWNTWGANSPSGIFSPSKPWMLEMFDQIRYYPVGEDELDVLRSQFQAGKFSPEMTVETFNLKEYSELLDSIDSEVQAQRILQEKATAEQNRLEVLSLKKLESLAESDGNSSLPVEGVNEIPANCELITAQITSLVNKVCVTEGMKVVKGQKLAVLEAMKANFDVNAPVKSSL